MTRRPSHDNRGTFGKIRGLGPPGMGRHPNPPSPPSQRVQRPKPPPPKARQSSPSGKPAQPKPAGPKAPPAPSAQGWWSQPPSPPTRQTEGSGPPPNGPQSPGPPAPTRQAPRSPEPLNDTSMDTTPTVGRSDPLTPSAGPEGMRAGLPAVQPQREQDPPPQVPARAAGPATTTRDRLGPLMQASWTLTVRPADEGGTRGIELTLTRPGSDGLRIRAATVREARDLLADQLVAAT
jgi:hypothetical protein